MSGQRELLDDAPRIADRRIAQLELKVRILRARLERAGCAECDGDSDDRPLYRLVMNERDIHEHGRLLTFEERMSLSFAKARAYYDGFTRPVFSDGA